MRHEVLREDTREPVVPELLRPGVEGAHKVPDQGGGRLPRAVARVVFLHDRLAAQLALRQEVGDGDEAPLGQGVDSRDPLRLDDLHGLLHHLPVHQFRQGQVRPAPPRGLRLPPPRKGLRGARLQARGNRHEGPEGDEERVPLLVSGRHEELCEGAHPEPPHLLRLPPRGPLRAEALAAGVQRQWDDPDRGPEDEQVQERLHHLEARAGALRG